MPPSFNDVRLVLNTAQLMGVTSTGRLDLATFDGDVTLYGFISNNTEHETNQISSYDDGQSLEPTNPVIQRIICAFNSRDLPAIPATDFVLVRPHEPQYQSRHSHSSRLY